MQFGRIPIAVGMALSAAFLWAAYYPLVLGVPGEAPPSGLLVWPFVVGGAAFTGWAVVHGHARAWRELWASPAAWVRAGFLAAMQTSVLASTYLAGAVDTALLSLVGDVVCTPIFLLAIYREGGPRIRSAGFAGGVLLCLAGATLTIAVGGTVRPLGAVALPVAAFVPVAISLYFLLMARAARTAPVSAVGGQATLGAALILLLASPLLPGGPAGLLSGGGLAVVALVAIGLTTFFVGPLLYFLAIERTGIVLPAVLMATIPVFTLLLSWSVLHVVPPALGLAGIPIAAVGAYLALRGEHDPWDPRHGPGTDAPGPSDGIVEQPLPGRPPRGGPHLADGGL